MINSWPDLIRSGDRRATSQPRHVWMMFDLSGRVALVTGASRGIGRAVAARLAGQGATVVAAARGDHAAETVAEVTAAGGQAEAVSLEMTDEAAVQRLPGDIVERHGR